MRRLLARAVMCAALMACSGTDIPTDLPHQQNIPAGAIIFKFDPAQLAYEFHDTTQGHDTHLFWLQGRGFSGINCVAFSPRSGPADTIGTFVFAARGPNTGFLERHDFAAVDTTTAYFLTGNEGSRGTYLIDATNQVHLFWSNGEQSRYFDPAAVLHIAGNDLTSNVTLSLSGDSVVVRWGVVWTQNDFC